MLILTFLIIYPPHDYTKFSTPRTKSFALQTLAINATARTENLPSKPVFSLPPDYSYLLRISRLHLHSTVQTFRVRRKPDRNSKERLTNFPAMPTKNHAYETTVQHDTDATLTLN